MFYINDHDVGRSCREFFLGNIHYWLADGRPLTHLETDHSTRPDVGRLLSRLVPDFQYRSYATKTVIPWDQGQYTDNPAVLHALLGIIRGNSSTLNKEAGVLQVVMNEHTRPVIPWDRWSTSVTGSRNYLYQRASIYSVYLAIQDLLERWSPDDRWIYTTVLAGVSPTGYCLLSKEILQRYLEDITAICSRCGKKYDLYVYTGKPTRGTSMKNLRVYERDKPECYRNYLHHSPGGRVSLRNLLNIDSLNAYAVYRHKIHGVAYLLNKVEVL